MNQSAWVPHPINPVTAPKAKQLPHRSPSQQCPCHIGVPPPIYRCVSHVDRCPWETHRGIAGVTPWIHRRIGGTSLGAAPGSGGGWLESQWFRGQLVGLATYAQLGACLRHPHQKRRLRRKPANLAFRARGRQYARGLANSHTKPKLEGSCKARFAG